MQCRGFRTDGVGVIGKARAIRRSDFVQLHARLPEDIGQTKRAADLDELTATDDDSSSGGQRLQREQRGGGTVVYDECRFGAGDFLAKSFDRCAAPAALAGRHVDFQVGAGRGCVHRLDRGRRERRAAEIGVNHDSRAVDHFAQALRGCTLSRFAHALDHETFDFRGIRREFVRLPVAHVAQDLANPVGHRRAAELCAERNDLRQVENSLHRRQQSQVFSVVGIHVIASSTGIDMRGPAERRSPSRDVIWHSSKNSKIGTACLRVIPHCSRISPTLAVGDLLK